MKPYLKPVRNTLQVNILLLSLTLIALVHHGYWRVNLILTHTKPTLQNTHYIYIFHKSVKEEAYPPECDKSSHSQ